MQNKVLVLSASYEAINICSMRRALLLVLSGSALTVEESSGVIHSPSLTIRVPEVIRLCRYVRVPYKDISFCRKNIILRDNNQCQYCGKTHRSEELTVDHIMPLSRGGQDAWDNVVTACKKCNNRKGSHLPKEIGMWPVNRPLVPTSATFLHLIRHMGHERHKWRKYLFFEETSPLESEVSRASSSVG